MTEANTGATVTIHYTGTLNDGREFDSSHGREPLTFTLGQGQVIPGFETAVMGLKPGEQKSFTIPCAEAYGEHRPELVNQVERSRIPEHIELQKGMQLGATTADGQEVTLIVTDMDDSNVTVDANHPLAGEDLTFQIEVVNVEAA